MSHQNAIREESEIRPALNAAHSGGFRVPRKRPDVIDSKWSGREDLNLRPPGPEPENSPFLKSGKIRNWKLAAHPKHEILDSCRCHLLCRSRPPDLGKCILTGSHKRRSGKQILTVS